MLAGLFALVSLAGAVSGPSAPQRYRIEVKSKQDVDLSAMGQGTQTTEFGAIGFLSVTMSDTTGGQLAHIVVDSLQIPAGLELPPGFSTDGGAGIFFHAYIVDGKVQGTLMPSAPHRMVSLLAGGIENLFPGLRTTAKLGDTWADTVKAESSAEGNSQKSVTMLDWKVTGGTTGMLTYEANTVGTLMREGPGPAGKQTINAKITGTRKISGPPAGPMHQGMIKAMQDLLVSMEGNPDAIPVTATTEITFVKLP